MFDLLIAGGEIIDGTGAPRRRAEVGVRRGRITVLPPGARPEAARALNATGLAVSPGFIDIHSHSDWCLLYDPEAEARLTQGVTTEVMGKCGYSAAPLGDLWLTWWWTPQEVPNDLGKPYGFGGAMSMARAREMLQAFGIDADWRTYGEYLERLEATRPGVNVLPSVGHNTIRTVVLGLDERGPTPDELDRMKAYVRDAMEAGAFALSSGLVYPPGRSAATEELLELCRVVGEYGGHYYTHLRSEGDGLLDAVREAIAIAEWAGTKLEIAHLKAMGRGNWGRLGEAIRLIEAAAARGVPAGVDAYPYTVAGITQGRLASLLPPSVMEGGVEDALQALAVEGVRRRVAEMIEEVWRAEGPSEMGGNWVRMAGGPRGVVLTRVGSDENRELVGKTLVEIAEARGVSPAQALVDLFIQERGRGSAVCHVIGEEDVETAVRSPLVGVGSDGHVGLRRALPEWALPHPRNYATFPRILAEYARRRRAISLEEGVRKMTGLNAERMGLTDRGRVADGCWADLVVFDPGEIDDRASYVDPWRTAAGIRWVLVNGDIAVEDGRLTGIRAGQIVRRSR